MRSFHLGTGTVVCLAVALAFVVGHGTARTAEVIQLAENNWDDSVPHGKEVDCIYGDWVLRNEHVVAVIAEALPGRNANMTVRNVGGSVIDLTVRDVQSDQLSAYYPLGAQYALEGPVPREGAPAESGSQNKAATLTFRGPDKEGRSKAEMTYELPDDARWLKIITRVTNTSDEPLELSLADAIRADGEFEFGKDDDLGLFWAYDPFWRQAYGALVADPAWQFAAGEPKRRGNTALQLTKKDAEVPKLPPGQSHEIVRYLIPAANTVAVKALAHELRGNALVEVALAVRDPDGPIDGASVDVKTADGKPYAQGRTDAKGRLVARLPAGNYQAVVAALGRGEKTLPWELSENRADEVELPAPGYVVADIKDAQGGTIACKVQFRGKGATPDPNFGPDSAIYGVRNLRYTPNGQFRAALAPGQYDVIISHGPEYDAVFTTLEVQRGQESPLRAELKRTVDTTGWISADFHSHSSPSGDNTASQRGRVLNLLAEHIEFAPCTEHNRLTVYDPHLEYFAAAQRMLSCPGIELTNSPGSVNHQNAFPMIPHPRTQDGGAPLTDVDPVVQIERLAMWHDGSDKLVQTNHPNIVQILGDRDLNGSPDGGFEKMFSFMDVIEVHPPEWIFDGPDSPDAERRRDNAIFNWLQLHNLGYRLPGVVNTDAHWNFHGSGFLRNYIKTATDDPAKASVPDLVHACEHGHIVITNGPFMEVNAAADQGSRIATVGDDLPAPGGKLHLKVRVQVPNWIEVNRVQVFVNGKPEPKWNFTRPSHPKMFHQAALVFDENLALELDADAHLVVACAGEGKQLGDVLGPEHGQGMPTAVGNPIFVDVDGDGFEPNGDLLGLPLPLEPGFKPSKPHAHHH